MTEEQGMPLSSSDLCRKYRLSKRWTQPQLALHVRYSTRQVQRWEAGSAEMPCWLYDAMLGDYRDGPAIKARKKRELAKHVHATGLSFPLLRSAEWRTVALSPKGPMRGTGYWQGWDGEDWMPFVATGE